MTKKEYEERLTKLENEINELRNVKIDDDNAYRYGDRYYYVDNFGDVNWKYWNGDNIDEYRMNHLFIFKTREECKRYLEIQKAFKEASFKPDWNDTDKNKYSLCYNYLSNFLMVVSTTFAQNANVNYFENKEVLINLIERFSEEDVKKYYLGIEE